MRIFLLTRSRRAFTFIWAPDGMEPFMSAQNLWVFTVRTLVFIHCISSWLPLMPKVWVHLRLSNLYGLPSTIFFATAVAVWAGSSTAAAWSTDALDERTDILN